MDPLSNVLSMLKPSSHYFAGLDSAGAWSFDFPGHEGLKLTVVVRGCCWAVTDDSEGPVPLKEGDCFLLNGRRRFIVSSDPQQTPEHSGRILEAAKLNRTAVHNGGGEVFLMSGRFTFSGSHSSVLLEALPGIIHIPSASSKAQNLRYLLDWMMSERDSEQPGGALAVAHLAHLILLQVLRLFLETSANIPKGWFFALADRLISPAIRAMQANPAHPWTLEELAGIAGASRTVFAQRFKSVVGITTMDYLSLWRMLLAADRLSACDENISSIAFSLGYTSESAFSTAFKRIMSCTPTQYRNRV